MNYRAIIADDEKAARGRLLRLLKKCAPEIAIIAETGDGKASCESIERLKPDLAFLDIQMPAAATGSKWRSPRPISRSSFL